MGFVACWHAGNIDSKNAATPAPKLDCILALLYLRFGLFSHRLDTTLGTLMADFWKKLGEGAKKAGAATLSASKTAYEKSKAAVDEQKRKGHAQKLSEFRLLEIHSKIDMSNWPTAEAILDLDMTAMETLLPADKLPAALASAKAAQREAQAKAQQAELEAKVLKDGMAWIENMFGDPSAVLSVKVGDAVSERNVKIVRDNYTNQYGRRAGPVSSASTASVVSGLIQTGTTSYVRGNIAATLDSGIPGAYIERPIASLNDQERAALHGAAILRAYSRYEKSTFKKIQMSIAWGSGQGMVNTYVNGKMTGMVEQAVRELLSAEYHSSINAVMRLLGEFQAIMESEDGDVAKALRNAFKTGQRWGEPSDLPEHRLRRYQPGDLLLGELNDGTGLGFNGKESLVTFGPPGRGKSQAHALLNLVTFNGPMIVLDLKGELLRDSAGFRQTEFSSRILRFSLLSDDKDAHRFNPLLMLDRHHDRLWDEARAMAIDLIPAPVGNTDPYWTNSARDLVAVLIGSMLLTDDPDEITFEELMMRLSLGGERRIEFLESVIERASKARITGLRNRAQSIIDLSSAPKNLESIYQNARQALACFESPVVQRATDGMDWHPKDLRFGSTTLYLALPMDQIEPYGPLIRAVIGAHIKYLTANDPERDDKTITFLLDELPQLGNFEAVVKAIEIGRSYGLRIWGFAQHAQQFEDSFARHKVLTDSPAVRCYMNTDLNSAEMISRSLGTVIDLFSGRETDLASPAELMGAEYENKIIVLQAGGHVHAVEKLMAYDVVGDRLGLDYQFTSNGWLSLTDRDLSEETGSAEADSPAK